MLERFGPATREWFARLRRADARAARRVGRDLAGDKHALVVAPTGSGKTLSAFLWAIDRLHARRRARGHRAVLYISPLKALGVDVERNLASPLVGIRPAARASASTVPRGHASACARATPRRRPARARHALRPTSSSRRPSRCT